ncbi:MAG: hypothetical protein QXF05_03885 [Thermofilaceae archaeon]
MSWEIKERYAGLISLFMRLAHERRFGPLDRMARALNPALVRASLYDALRIAVSEGWPLPPREEVEDFLDEVERNLSVAQKLAAIAITAAPVSEPTGQSTSAATPSGSPTGSGAAGQPTSEAQAASRQKERLGG